MSYIVGWIVGKIKWLLVIAAIGGPVAAYIGWADVDRTNNIVAIGKEAEARIVSATRKKGRKSGTSYAADLAWKDDKGADRRVEDVRISSALAGRLFRDDRIVVDRVKIKYLPEETGKEGLVLVDDVTEQLELDRFMMYGGGIAGLIGMLGCAWFFGLFGMLKAKPKEEFARDGRATMGPPT